MPDHEDLYEDMERKEEADARLLKFERPFVPRRDVNASDARERYLRDFAPVIARQKRALAGQPITRNPLVNLYLKLTGKDKVPTPEVVKPTKDFMPIPPKTP
jgi:hypothetical protein